MLWKEAPQQRTNLKKRSLSLDVWRCLTLLDRAMPEYARHLLTYWTLKKSSGKKKPTSLCSAQNVALLKVPSRSPFRPNLPTYFFPRRAHVHNSFQNHSYRLRGRIVFSIWSSRCREQRTRSMRAWKELYQCTYRLEIWRCSFGLALWCSLPLTYVSKSPAENFTWVILFHSYKE